MARSPQKGKLSPVELKKPRTLLLQTVKNRGKVLPGIQSMTCVIRDIK